MSEEFANLKFATSLAWVSCRAALGWEVIPRLLEIWRGSSYQSSKLELVDAVYSDETHELHLWIYYNDEPEVWITCDNLMRRLGAKKLHYTVIDGVDNDGLESIFRCAARWVQWMMLSNIRVVVRGKNVEFEDGQIVEVPRFAISQKPVSLSQFYIFSSLAGFQTTGEKKGLETYLSNQSLSGISLAENVWVSPVRWLSISDAAAYAKWRGCRLPQESEWLSAVLESDEIVSYQVARQMLRARATAMSMSRMSCHDSAYVYGRDGHPVVRSGPNVVRHYGWRMDQRRAVIGYDDVEPLAVCLLVV